MSRPITMGEVAALTQKHGIIHVSGVTVEPLTTDQVRTLRLALYAAEHTAKEQA
ncbi:hypothetical protein ACL1CN_10385 [Corynebacterium striatum]|nr:hypothetical protein [Corynebacterium striatum]HCG2985201.1 hypothetical protein [Corynebacterium striatum]HCG3001023.1 hypothetical protein [Corynebacterium striatum]HCG3016914.1 hypothetical protein [Corynebacterium striatum]HCG3138752.1 hypothetical protein [Corynebacterium striatum]